MPQQTLLPDNPPMTRLTLEITDRTPDLVDGVNVTVRVAVGQEPLRTVAVASLHGRMSEYLNTLVEEVTSAWHYEGSPRDVARTVASVVKVARKHARAHDRQGELPLV